MIIHHKIKDNGTIEERLVSQQEKEDLEFKINPRYWVTSLDVREKFIDKNGDKWWKKPWLLAFRGITSPTNERTIIATVLPSNVGAGDNIPLLLPNCEADLAA